MTNSFLSALQSEGTKNVRTENGAVTHSTTSNAVLDFFALAGAKRNDHNGAKTLFRKAYAEDRQLAIRALFYLRDIRGGQGERDLFRVLYTELASIDIGAADDVARFIPEYGRWDDVVSVVRSQKATQMIAYQLDEDARSERPSLMAKWLPSENASSKESRRKARELATDLGLSNREYRKRVVELRKRIGLLEQKMSENDWSSVEYGKIPSQAGRKHSKAFKRHDEDRYSAFLDRATRGEEKMNTGTVYTYEVLDLIRKGQEQTANAIWANLPDYTNGSNALVVADTSGSMGDTRGRGYGLSGVQPIDVAVSLALYFAERNNGPFKDYFVTFSEEPQLVKVTGNTLTQKLHGIGTASWGFNTDIAKVFDLILRAAKGANPEDVPKVIYIVSDMEFDQSIHNGRSDTAYEVAKQKFRSAGFELPHVVFWNVASRNTNVPTHKDALNVTLISGLSQSTFQHAIQGKTPLESMLDILNGERYSQIVI